MMTRTGRRGIPVLIAALAVLALVVGLFTTHAQPAHAADATITSLLSRLDAGFSDLPQGDYHNQTVGYNSVGDPIIGHLSPAWFNYPAGFSPSYTVERLHVSQSGNTGSIVPVAVSLVVRGAVTSVEDSVNYPQRVLPPNAGITLHLEADNFTRSYSLDNPTSRTALDCVDENEVLRPCRVGEIISETYEWDTNLPPLLTDGDSILVRLRYKAPRPGTPGTPTVTAPSGKSGALVVEWAAPSSNDPAVVGYQVYVTRGSQLRLKSVDASTTRLSVLLLEPDTAYDVRVRARTDLAIGPSSGTARARTNPLQGTNTPQVTLDLNGVMKVKEGDGLPMRLKVKGMPNLHAGAFPKRFEGEPQLSGVQFLLLDRIAKAYTYEDHPGGCSGGSFRSGALTIGDDGEVYHDSGYLVIPKGMSKFGPLYVELDTRCGNTSSSNNVRIDTMERQCVEIADSSNNVPTDRTCSSGGMSGHAVDRLTARFVGVPRSHDGESEFTLRVAFIKDVGISPTSLREDALTVTGGRVTQAQRVDDRSDLFEITVEPASDEDVTITLAASSDCAAAGAICTEGEDPKKLYNSPAATVSGPTLTASFQGLPSQHDGETAFSFRIAFNDDIATDEEEFRDHSVEVWGGRVTRAQPVDQRRDLWEVEIEPASDDLVMISLRPSLSCDETGAVCTAGGRRLSVSPATMVAGPATWPVQVNGEAQVGKTLIADTSNISDRFGVQVTSMTYQWLANNARIPGASAQSYTLGEGKQGRKISVMATYTDDRGNEDTLTSGPTEPVAARERNSRATGLPLISGRALVGQTLTADTSLIFDADGLENSVFSYLWEADDDSIPGATDPTYTPVQADVGKVITVIVSFLDAAGYSQSMTSPDTMAVTTAEAAAKVGFAHSLRYAANVDGSVTLYWNASDDEVTGYRIFRRRYSLGEPKGLVYVEDTGSAATTYTDTEVTAGAPHSYRVQVIRGSELGEKTKFFKTKVFPLRKAANSPATGAPSISGTTQVGETLTADTSGIVDADGLENVTQNYLWGIDKGLIIGAVYGYQWLADEAEIEDATRSTYILADGDEGKAIKVRVSFTDDGGHRETLTSSATAAVTQPNTPAIGLPTVSGKARVGETLTVDTSGISDENGLDDATFTHQWITDDSVVVGTGTRAYTPTGGDQGKAVKVRVSFSDDAGNWETRTSAQTATVEARSNSAGICDRTAQVRDVILDQLPNTSDCAAVTGMDLSGIIRLALSEKGITTLKSGDFSGLSNLQHLNLADNELSALPDGIFDNLTGLESLYLYSNRLSELPDGIFDDLTGLEELQFFNNYIRGLPDNIFDNLTGLEGLNLGGNWISELPDGVFENLTGLEALSLGFNDLSELPDGVFDNLTRLYSLGVGNNDLGELPDDVFDNLTGLGALTLTNIDLRELPDGIFDELTRLDTLVLSDNDLSELPDGIFDELNGLWTLKLDGNDFSELPDGVFDNLTKLWSLSVSGNELSALPDDVFDNLAKLQSLDLNSNELSELSEGVFDGLTELQYLHLNGNELSELPDGIFDGLTELRTVSVDYNELSELPDGVFDNLSELWALSLIGNELSELPDGIFDNLANLKQLYLFSNKLSELPDRIFYGLASMNILYIDENTGSPFTLTAELERTDENTIALKVAQATPFDMEVTLSAEGGSLSSATVLMPAGNVSSEQITVSPDGAEPVTISVVSAAFLLGESQEARGIQTGLGNHLTLGEDSDTNTPSTGAPTIRGTAQVGEALTADTADIADADGLTGATFSYQWLGSRDTEIQGATNATYTLVADDEGKTIKVRVTFTDDGGDEETLTSEATAAVSAAPPPPPDNVGAVTQKSGAVELTWEAPQDATVTSYRIERSRADENRGSQQRSDGHPRDNHTLVEDTGSAETGYTDKSAEKGVEYEYRVSARNEAGTGEASEWVRAGPEPVFGDGPPGAPGNLTVTAGDQEITLSWEPPADNGNPPATRYRIEWRMDGKDYTRSQWGTSGSTTYTKTELANGVKYVFRVKAENGTGNYGPYGPASEEVSATPTSGSAVDLGTPVLSRPETLHHGMIQLDWEDIEDAGWYVVQYYHVEDGEWLDLPAEGVDIAVHGSSAVVSNLHGLSWLRVRAMSCAGESEWSQIEQLFGTNASDWEGVPVPEVAEGDEIEPCPVVLGTPVLSNTKTLHHGMVRLDWQDIEDAGWYVVQYYYVKSGEWLDLPAAGVDIAFHGSSAVVSNLHGLSWLRVRAMSCAGESEWSQIEQLFGTNASDWEDVPVPEVAEGDQIAPCDEDADTSDNSPATGAPAISGTARVGEVLTADITGISDVDGLANVSFTYRWMADDAEITGAVGITYVLTSTELGEAIRVQVSFTDDAGNHETLTSGATERVAASATPNSPATGVPTISGTAQVGETLTADVSGIADADGMENDEVGFYWSAYDDATGRNLLRMLEWEGTYTIEPRDVGMVISVQAVFKDDRGNVEFLESAPTDTVAAVTPNSPATGAPTISGTVQVGETLTANTSGIEDADGLTNVSFSYQWLSSRDTEIGGATSSTYTLVAADEGKAIKVKVSFTDDAGNNETLTSAATGAVDARPNSPATGVPTISGTAQVGETLTADTSGIADADGLSNVRYEYQWLADDAEIAGATGLTYTLTAADEGKAIKVKVSFTDDANNQETLTSAATDAVAAAESSEPSAKPSGLSATASHGSVTLTWDDPGDDTITGYVILRRVRVNNTGGDFSELVADTGTAATTYTDDTVVASTTYTYRIKAINGAGTSERSHWFHIDTPAAPVPDNPTGLEATTTHGQVVLTWDDPGDDSITGYVILRRVRVNNTGGDFSVLVADTASAATTYTDDTVVVETTYTYRIKAINEYGVSERSRWYHIDIPAAP